MRPVRARPSRFSAFLGAVDPASMKKCTACGFNNPEERDRCFRCSAALGRVDLPSAAEVADREPDRLAGHLGMLGRAWYFVEDRLFHEDPRVRHDQRWPLGAILCAFVPGLAQFYTGRRVLAAAVGLVQLALLAAVVATFFHPKGNYVLLAWHLFNMLAAAEAYRMAQRINGYELLRRNIFFVWFALMASTGFVLMMAQFFAFLLGFRLVSLVTDDLEPVFQRGDRILVYNMPLWFGGMPQRGDVVYYTPPPMRYEIQRSPESTDLVSATPIRTIAVVQGIAGDTIAWKDPEPPSLNGQPLPPELLPLNPAGLARQFRISPVPPGRYVALVSTPVSEFKLYESWGGTAPTPRELESRKAIFRNFEEANMGTRDKTIGIVLCRYNPPHRRAWIGRGKGFSNLRKFVPSEDSPGAP